MDLARCDELLSAYLDRELSPDERAAVDRLLEKSDEARTRLRELEVTSRFMRSLPQHQLGVDFADNVIDRLRSESLLRPEPVAPKPARRRSVWWVGAPLAAAASVLVALGIWDYQLGPRKLTQVSSPFDRKNSDLLGPSVASIDNDQWEQGDILEIRGPNGEKQFELFVLAKPTEPNTIRCILAESRNLEPALPESVAPQNEPAVAQGVTALAIEADEQQIEQLHGLLAQSDDGTGAAFPLVDIVTDKNPQRVRVAEVGPEMRSAGLAGNQQLLAARESSKLDEGAEPASPAKGQTPSTFAANQQVDSATSRRVRGTAPPADLLGATVEQKRNVTAGESAPARSEIAQVEKKAPAGVSEATKSAAAFQNRGQQAPVRIKQLDIRQQTAGAPAAVTATTPHPSTPDQVEKLKKLTERERAEPSRTRVGQPDDKDPLRRHIEVLLIIRNDRPE